MLIVILLIRRELVRSGLVIKCARRADWCEGKGPKPNSELTRGPTKPPTALRGGAGDCGSPLPLNIPLL